MRRLIVSAEPRSRTARIAVLFLLLPALASGLSCSERKRLTGPGDGTGDFQLGPRTTYTVPAGGAPSVSDSVSGGIFSFTAGGGSLSVAPILSGPKPSAAGKSFWVEYRGSARVRLEFPDEPGQTEILYGYGVDLGSISDSLGRTKRWTCVPVADTLVSGAERRIRFELVPPFDWTPPGAPLARLGAPLARVRAALSPAAPERRVGFEAYHLGRIPAGSSSEVRFRAAERQFWSYFSSIVDSLPSALGGYVATQVASGARYEPTIYNSDDHKYKGFLYLSSLVPITRPMVFLGPNATAHSVAHELGHFVNHIIAGDARYLAYEAQAPDDHIPGRPIPGRNVLVEECAYFSDYFCTGTILNADAEEPWTFFQSFEPSRNATPASTDWPAMEGFGAILLASLVRQSPTIRTAGGSTEEFPVVGASFREVWPLAARGTPSLGELRDSVEALLGRRGQRALAPVLGERIGWRYHGGGRLVDEEGRPLANARVQAVLPVGPKTWRTPATAVTGSDGRFQLPRLFPGDGKLRVWRGTDSTDVDLRIEWSQPTNVPIDRTIQLAGGLLAQLQRSDYLDVSFSGEIRWSDGTEGTMVSLTTFASGFTPLSWNGTRCTQSYALGGPGWSLSVQVDGRVSATGRKIESLSVTVSSQSASMRRLQSFTMANVEVSDINEGEIIFTREGSDLQGIVTVADELQPAGQPARTISSIRWESDETPPEIVVFFHLPD